MRPPALQITLTLQAPGDGWHYLVRKMGEPVACSDGETFNQPGRALMAAVAEVKSTIQEAFERGQQ